MIRWLAIVAMLATGTAAGDALHQPFPDLEPDLRLQYQSRDLKGLKRDSWSILGYQAAAIGVLYAMPEDISKWSAHQKDNLGFGVWWENASNPVWDKDPDVINYVLHPYWGASYFVRARERGFNDRESFLYSVLLSSAYEFGTEALVEKASIQDLLVTPIAGALLGKYFMSVRTRVRDRQRTTGSHRATDKWLLALTDPIGAANSGLSKLFPRDAVVALRPYGTFNTASPISQSLSQGRTIATDSTPVYGLQLQISWK